MSCAAQGGNVGPNVGSNDNQRRSPNLARDLLSELADLPNPFSGNPASEAATKVHPGLGATLRPLFSVMQGASRPG